MAIDEKAWRKQAKRELCPDCGAEGAHFCTGKPNQTASEAARQREPDANATVERLIKTVNAAHLELYEAKKQAEQEQKRLQAVIDNLAHELVMWREQCERAKRDNVALLQDAEAARRGTANEKQKNLFDRKLFIFASMVQTWLAAPVMGIRLTSCRAAWIQGQAFLVSPAVLGEMGANFNQEGSLAWQAYDFCKTLSEFDQWPSWTELR